MEIKAEFFSVGHGLTYGFQYYSYNLLFDITAKKGLIDDVKDFIGNNIIDTLVISHFHHDHISGLKKLTSSGISIRQTFVPCIDDDERFILELIVKIKPKSKIVLSDELLPIQTTN